jgi:hypothetical protein
MSRCTVRYILTVFIYAGAAIFLWPYLTGHISTGALFLVGGAGLAVVSGLLRCCFIEGDCPDRIPTSPSSNQNTARAANR